MNFQLLDVRSNLQQVQEIWCELCNHCPHSYFLSWGWIEHWLSSLPANVVMKLAVLYKGDLPCLAFFAGQTQKVRHYFVQSKSLFLNATGDKVIDRLFIEYNAMLLRSDAMDCSLQELLTLLPVEWDEFAMPGLDVKTFPGNAIQQPLGIGNVIVESDMPSPYVDLNLVRQANGNYLSLVSSNTRSSLNRAYRGYKEKGELSIEVADNLSSATDIFDDLVALHQATWEGRATESAFISDFSLSFHRKLISKRLDCGDIQLFRVRVGDTTIGCLYNFVYADRVLFYQSGFRYEEDRRLTPGFICLAEAIKYNADKGFACFDFLASHDGYKSRLATGENRLVWAIIQKPRIVFQLETGLKSLKKKLSQQIVTQPNDATTHAAT